MHKLTAGSGYDYLTRQVATLDSTEKGHTTLASYYTEKGEAPGQWVGSGIEGIDGVEAGDIVTAEQMKALFAYGFHPLADSRLAELDDTATDAQIKQAQRLGTPFKVYSGDVPPFLIEVARRIEDVNIAAGRPRNHEVPLEDRARVRTQVATEWFEREHGRAPHDAREIAAKIAKLSRPKTTAVAGYDLTFSPVKSVSALWAIAEPQVAARIELAHQAAVKDALTFIEDEALYTRVGTNGARQVNVRGMVATAFTHRDSRAGDPDLHTHVAVANKVQTLDGRWLAIDGRVLYKATVSASEVYNTALERHLAEGLGVKFAERAHADPRKRPVREIVGVDARLNERWSSRRASIEQRRAELATAFQSTHGRPPTPVEAIQLAQQATLETREAKHEPRSIAEQRAAWSAEASRVLGGPQAIADMVAAALSMRHGVHGHRVTSEWISATANRVVDEVQQRRSVWQVWHLRAEAQRQVRGAEVSPPEVATVVNLIVDAAIDRSVQLTTDRDEISEPAALRRTDGASVYTVAGATTYTSQQILDAEQRIVDAAGRGDGRQVPAEIIDLALLESAANGVELNAGQAELVRTMASSGARVQLGIAAAGTGKTTAMSVLTRAWEDGGGNVVGLAPSAAAAAALREQTGATTETLAKLITDLEIGSGALPQQIGPRTLVLIDEAGMADTLALDAAITHVLEQGASVRLIGDDQQLAAIGAGGVLRDIDHHHGAVRLAELMRFNDPAEAAATLALRDGLPESVGFYLDNDRVHVGDLTTLTEAVFTAWQSDRAEGLDSIMLAPTRELVSELNHRAREARLSAGDVALGPRVRLADGNEASIGDVILTRNNDRRLRISATDWVKNGDRWTIAEVRGDGSLQVHHAASGLRAMLPISYVRQHVELGYASTVHTAQGVSVDTMHGVATGDEARQQLYTMMTRGRDANHLYLVTASDGDEHSRIRPETIHPSTAVDVIATMLARDGAPTSATTTAREAADPSVQLGQAASRYSDAISVAAEAHIGTDRTAEIDHLAEQLVPGIADEPAWPALRAHLVLREANGLDAVADLTRAVSERELDGVDDRAAILDWRLDSTGMRGGAVGPLPWLPAIPDGVAADPAWGSYLQARDELVRRLSAEVREKSLTAETPTWARQGTARPSAEVLGEVAVWRAAMLVDPADRRPTGPRALQKAPAVWQKQLDEQVNAGRSPALEEWGPLIDALHPRRDAFTSLLAERLAAISRAGIDAGAVFRRAAGEGALPDEHVAAAMWWRIARHIAPSASASASQDTHLGDTSWSTVLVDHLGDEGASDVMASPSWPALISTIEHAQRRGWSVEQLMDVAKTIDVDDVDPAQAIIWRIAIVTDPPPEDQVDTFDAPPEDMDELFDPADLETRIIPDGTAELVDAAAARMSLGALEPTDADLDRINARAYEWESSPVAGERILAINEASCRFYEGRLAGSWAELHLHERLGVNLAGDARYRPGYAPAGWNVLVNHLQAQGFSTEEMLAAGVAKESANGRIIDRFRDRAVLPILKDGEVLGFVGRRNPEVSDPKAGPKYLNTPDTIAFHKGAQLYGLEKVAPGAVPVLVEGPLDAIAVTVATDGAYVGVAPLGTSLTEEQAAQLATLSRAPIVATDGDLAGTVAAERAHWLTAPHQLSALRASMAADEDPASILQTHGPQALHDRLDQAHPLVDDLLAERSANISDTTELIDAVAVVTGASSPVDWGRQITATAADANLDPVDLKRQVAAAAQRFNVDRRRVSALELSRSSQVRARLENGNSARPVERWGKLARGISARLTSSKGWPAAAQMLQDLHDKGHNVEEIVHQATTERPLSAGDPAQDLRYRLLNHLPSAGLESTQRLEAPQRPQRPPTGTRPPTTPPR